MGFVSCDHVLKYVVPIVDNHAAQIHLIFLHFSFVCNSYKKSLQGPQFWDLDLKF